MDEQNLPSFSRSQLRAAIALDILLKVGYVIFWILLIIVAILFLMACVYPAIGAETIQRITEYVPKYVMVLSLAALFVMNAVALLVIVQLRKISNTLTAGDPFVPQNANRLRRLWMIVGIGEIIFTAIISAILITNFNGPDLNLANSWIGDMIGMSSNAKVQIPIRFTVWFFVLVLIVLEQVFRLGAQMREDQQFTV